MAPTDTLRLSDHSGYNYIAAGEYNSYLQNKIYNEQRLEDMLCSAGIIKESSAYVVLEAKLSDRIKGTWNKFIEFIKGLVDKFMESMSNILLSEKTYLEKYKDIILNRKPKDDMTYSYTGNYEVGIQRMIDTEIPVFNYEAHAAALKQSIEEGSDAPILTKIMSGKQGWTYDDSQSLADMFKNYYLDLDDGKKEGKFSDLNFTNMYNFCYNFKTIKDMVDKDVHHLESSTNAIQNAITKELSQANMTDADTEDNKPNRQQGEKTQTNTNNNTTTNVTTNGGSENNNKNEAAFMEADDNAKKTGLTITNSNAEKKMNSYEDNKDPDETTKAGNAAIAKKQGDASDTVTKICKKWIDVCNPIITAKLYACQQISKDYMQIIRAHVRSYGGKDLKKDTTTTKPTDQATNYQKHGANNGNETNNVAGE